MDDSATINFDILADDEFEEPETIVISLDESLNLGPKHVNQVTITEDNLPPVVTLTVKQQDQKRLTVTKDATVTITSSIYDPNEGDTFSFEWEAESESISNQSEVANIYSFDPSSLDVGVYNLRLTVTDSGEIPAQGSAQVFIRVIDTLEPLTSADSDGDGIPDSVEGFADEDGDGISDYLDRIDECNVLNEVASVQDGYLIESEPGVCLRRGDITMTASSGGGHITDTDVDDSVVSLTADTEAVNVGGIMDFIAYGSPEYGESIAVAFPQRKPIPKDAVYRKYRQDTGWTDFIEDENNSLWSTAGEPGYCPPTRSDLWTEGLTEGHWCVQVMIEDGGSNDDDGVANGTVVDPGFVGTRAVGNGLPVAKKRTVKVKNYDPVDIDMTDYVSDPDGDPITLTSADANFGSVTISGLTIGYTPLNGYGGDDSIVYGISDGNGGTDTEVITIDMSINGPPEPGVIATPDIVLGKGSASINVLDLATDPEDDDVEVVAVSAIHGTVSINPDGTIEYTPDPDYEGVDTITYTLRDSEGNETVATFDINVFRALKIDVKTKTAGGSLSFGALVILLLTGVRRLSGGLKKALSLLMLLAVSATLYADGHAEKEVEDDRPAWSSLVRGWYIGGDFGRSITNVDKDDLQNNFDTLNLDTEKVSADTVDWYWSLLGGYKFNSYFALELGYQSWGNREVTFEGITADQLNFVNQVEGIYPDTGKGLSISGVFSYPFFNKWRASGRLGGFDWKRGYSTESDGNTVGNSSIEGTDITLAGNLGYFVRPDTEVYLEYETTGLETYQVNNYGLGLRYFFGREPMPEPVPEPEPEPEPPKDTDGDGVYDHEDQCPGTPLTHKVDDYGCSIYTVKSTYYQLQIQFAHDSTKISKNNHAYIKRFAEFLKEYPEIEAVIEGHTSSVGSLDYSVQLSIKRAVKVMDTLTKTHGIDPKRLKATAYGETRLFKLGKTEAAHKANRRVQATVEGVSKIPVPRD